jgi:transposase InsO family protein
MNCSVYLGRLRGVRTDNGGEFRDAFASCCRKLRLKHLFAWVRCPDQNGKVERFNRTLREESLLGTREHHLPLQALHADLRRFLAYYNHRRLHSALGYRPSAELLRTASAYVYPCVPEKCPPNP